MRLTTNHVGMTRPIRPLNRLIYRAPRTLAYAAELSREKALTLVVEPGLEHQDRPDGGRLVVTREMLGLMKPGAVIIDVAIDQGGCVETARETTHSDPTYTVDGIVHYAVSNMPGALPQTSSVALANATLPYVLEIADKGWQNAMQESTEIKLGANVIDGQVTYKAVAEAFDLEYTPVDTFL